MRDSSRAPDRRSAERKQNDRRGECADDGRDFNRPLDADHRSRAAEQETADRPQAPIHKEKTQHPSQQMRGRDRLKGGIDGRAKRDEAKTHRNQKNQRQNEIVRSCE